MIPKLPHPKSILFSLSSIKFYFMIFEYCYFCSHYRACPLCLGMMTKMTMMLKVMSKRKMATLHPNEVAATQMSSHESIQMPSPARVKQGPSYSLALSPHQHSSIWCVHGNHCYCSCSINQYLQISKWKNKQHRRSCRVRWLTRTGKKSWQSRHWSPSMTWRSSFQANQMKKQNICWIRFAFFAFFTLHRGNLPLCLTAWDYKFISGHVLMHILCTVPVTVKELIVVLELETSILKAVSGPEEMLY